MSASPMKNLVTTSEKQMGVFVIQQFTEEGVVSRTCGFQGTAPNFFAIAPTRSNSSSISRGSDAAVPLRRRYLHRYEQWNDCWSCWSGRGYDNSVQPGGSRHTGHPSHHPCSELWILQHSDQDFL